MKLVAWCSFGRDERSWEGRAGLKETTSRCLAGHAEFVISSDAGEHVIARAILARLLHHSIDSSPGYYPVAFQA
jgi:hypothetical protein